MSEDEIRQVELLVNRHVVDNEGVETDVLPYDAAIAKGAIAFFDEKYGDEVRVLSVGSESVELCGGTHVSRTGDIGLFKVVSEGPISAGVRRLEAVTGMDAVNYALKREAQVRHIAAELRVGPDEINDRVARLIEEKRVLGNELSAARLAWRKAEALSSVQSAKLVNGKKVAAIRLDGVPGKDVRPLAESLRDVMGSGIVLVAGTDEGKVSLVIANTADIRAKVPAGAFVSELAPLIGGKGGGKPDVAQAGGADLTGLDALIAAFYAKAESALA
jgi:alanyl-tRNA synthetase